MAVSMTLPPPSETITSAPSAAASAAAARPTAAVVGSGSTRSYTVVRTNPGSTASSRSRWPTAATAASLTTKTPAAPRAHTASATRVTAPEPHSTRWGKVRVRTASLIGSPGVGSSARPSSEDGANGRSRQATGASISMSSAHPPPRTYSAWSATSRKRRPAICEQRNLRPGPVREPVNQRGSLRIRESGLPGALPADVHVEDPDGGRQRPAGVTAQPDAAREPRGHDDMQVAGSQPPRVPPRHSSPAARAARRDPR